MYKVRRFMPPLPDYEPGSYDLLRPLIRFISIPRANAAITFEFESIISPLLNAAAVRAGRSFDVNDDHVVLPVHELQVPHIEDKFLDAIVFPEEYYLRALAQQSLRLVANHGSQGP